MYIYVDGAFLFPEALISLIDFLICFSILSAFFSRRCTFSIQDAEERMSPTVRTKITLALASLKMGLYLKKRKEKNESTGKVEKEKKEWRI